MTGYRPSIAGGGGEGALRHLQGASRDERKRRGGERRSVRRYGVGSEDVGRFWNVG